MITCGKPAVPNIKAAVIQKISILLFVVDVYSWNPSSVTTEFSLESIGTSLPAILPMKPSWGIGLFVTMIDMKIAGTVYANINTTY